MCNNYLVVLCHELTSDGKLSAETKSRTDYAIKLYHSQPKIRLIMSGGDAKSGDPISHAMQTYAVKKGVDAKHILTESYSRDTVAQLSFVRVGLLEPLNVTRPHLITNSYHANRVGTFARTILPHNAYQVMVHPVVLPPNIDEQARLKQELSIGEDGLDRITKFREMFGNVITSNDIIECLFSKHPLYHNNNFLKNQVNEWIANQNQTYAR